MKVAICLTAAQSTDPLCDESFIAGYESAGGVWSGELTIIENVFGGGNLPSESLLAYDLVTWNGPNGDTSTLISNSLAGVQYVLPAGSNAYHTFSHGLTFTLPIICGSGVDVNQTGYACQFFDIDPQVTPAVISHMMQGTTSYTISKIARVSSTVIRLQLTGISDVVSLGFEHGFPIRISGLTGTDISPKPSGLYYLSSADTNNLYFTFTTSAGTIGTLQTPSAGTIKTGTNDGYVLIKTNPGGLWLNGNGINIAGVTGFPNNPNGARGVNNFVNVDGYYTKFEIGYVLGDGDTYLGGGTVRFDSESYATPYIAGKLAYIKDTKNCSWYEAFQRMRLTASGGGSIINQYDGYGVPNVAAAIAYSGSIPENPYVELSAVGDISLKRLPNNNTKITMDEVDNALTYEVYRDGALYDTSDTAVYETNIPRILKGHGENIFQYKALNPLRETDLSDEVLYKNFKFEGMEVKDNT